MIAQVEFVKDDVTRVVPMIVAIGQGTYAFAPALFGLIREVSPSLGPAPAEAAPYLFVLAAAIQRAGGVSDRKKILAALNQVTVAGANGDNRGFNERNHEGVVDDDVYFARFDGMTYRPVKDDPLSATLVPIEQQR